MAGQVHAKKKAGDGAQAAVAGGQQSANKRSVTGKRGSIYKKQLLEKQKVKRFYGVREEQFRRFFELASRGRAGKTGENLLCLLERRVDNILYRLKLASSRKQARQMVVHGHVYVNDAKIKSPSMLLKEGDKVSFSQRTLDKPEFVRTAIEKRLNIGIKVPEWLELRKNEKVGVVSRLPERSEVQIQAEEHLIVELYSK